MIIRISFRFLVALDPPPKWSTNNPKLSNNTAKIDLNETVVSKNDFLVDCGRTDPPIDGSFLLHFCFERLDSAKMVIFIMETDYFAGSGPPKSERSQCLRSLRRTNSSEQAHSKCLGGLRKFGSERVPSSEKARLRAVQSARTP